MSGVALSLITPFLSLFIETLGEFSPVELNLWSGTIFAASFLTNALTAPLWGRLADKYGRKPMLLRASLSMAVVMALMGLAQNVVQLLILRLIFGALSGFQSNAIALIAASTPKDRSGRVLGTINTANVGGVLVGPIFGGGLATFLGYNHIFFVTGGILLLVFLGTLLFVKENFHAPASGTVQTIRGVFAKIERPHLIIGMCLATLIITMTNTSINPFLPLYVREIIGSSQGVELLAGLVAAAPGFATLFSAPLFGALGDRIGTHRVLMGGFLLAAVLFLPMAFVSNVWQLIALRFCFGIAAGALLPGVQTMLARFTPAESTSRIFSFNQSAQSAGCVIGPLVGSMVAGLFDYRQVFFCMMAFALAGFLNAAIVTRDLKR
jgi:DHA1 family multidrug resistance protein-like MFS transporter